jgi:hypothetical protein
MSSPHPRIEHYCTVGISTALSAPSRQKCMPRQRATQSIQRAIQLLRTGSATGTGTTQYQQHIIYAYEMTYGNTHTCINAHFASAVPGPWLPSSLPQVMCGKGIAPITGGGIAGLGAGVVAGSSFSAAADPSLSPCHCCSPELSRCTLRPAPPSLCSDGDASGSPVAAFPDDAEQITFTIIDCERGEEHPPEPAFPLLVLGRGDMPPVLFLLLWLGITA